MPLSFMLSFFPLIDQTRFEPYALNLALRVCLSRVAEQREAKRTNEGPGAENSERQMEDKTTQVLGSKKGLLSL